MKRNEENATCRIRQDLFHHSPLLQKGTPEACHAFINPHGCSGFSWQWRFCREGERLPVKANRAAELLGSSGLRRNGERWRAEGTWLTNASLEAEDGPGSGPDLQILLHGDVLAKVFYESKNTELHSEGNNHLAPAMLGSLRPGCFC